MREKVELEPVSHDRECAPRSPVQGESEHGPRAKMSRDIYQVIILSNLVSPVCMPRSGVSRSYGSSNSRVFFFSLFSFIFISWRLITLQYWSGFGHTLR